MQIFLILFIVLEVLFGVYLIRVGIALLMFKSAKQELEKYQKDKPSRTFGKRWFLGWGMPLGRSITKGVIKVLGDRWATLFYKAAGIFFIICSPIFFIAPIFQIQLLLL